MCIHSVTLLYLELKPGTVTVEPLANKRQVSDLVTDIVPPKERLKDAIAGREKG